KPLLDPGPEATLQRPAFTLDLKEQKSLLLRASDRRLDLDLDKLIAPQTQALESEYLSGLGARRQVERSFSGESLHLHLPAERGFAHFDGGLTYNVFAVKGKPRVPLQLQHDLYIPSLAGQQLMALVFQVEHLSFVDARRNRDFQLRRLHQIAARTTRQT